MDERRLFGRGPGPAGRTNREEDAPWQEQANGQVKEKFFERILSDARPEPVPIVLKVFKANDFAKMEAPEQEWEVQDIIPSSCVTGLCGDGAGGKSLSALQLGVAQTSGTDWFGKLPRKGKCLILSCEDGRDEVHRRIRNITGPMMGRSDFNVEDLANLEIIDMVGEESLLARLDGRTHTLIPTLLYDKIIEHLDGFMGPWVTGSEEGRVLILDTLSKVYGGDENVRMQVTQFIGFLDRLAIKYHVAIILLIHPSLAGIASGSGSSGSTGWHGSVRARMYLTAPDPADTCLRELKILKNNYGPSGEIIKIRWDKGRYVLVAGRPAGAFGNEEIDRVFLDLVDQFTRCDDVPSLAAGQIICTG
jgi:RecA-family ATPase